MFTQTTSDVNLNVGIHDKLSRISMLLGNFRHTWQSEDLVLGRCRTEKRLLFLSTLSLMTKQPLLPAARSAHVFGCDVVKIISATWRFEQRLTLR